MMKTKNRLFLLGLAFFLACAVGSARADDSVNERVTKPTSVGLELFGRGILWDLHVDEVLSEELAAGIGYGSVGIKTPGGADLNNSAKFIPVYMNYYFMKEQGSVFATLGANLVLNQNDVSNTESNMGGVKFNSSGVLPTLGVGYENRSPTGVILQVTAYGLVAKSFYPWFGFSLGFAF